MQRRLALLTLLVSCAAPMWAQAPADHSAILRRRTRRAAWPTITARDTRAFPAVAEALPLLLRNAGVRTLRVTQNDIRRFQRANGLVADGVVGPQTWARLCPQLKRGNKGEAVSAFQTLLNGMRNSYNRPMYGLLATDGSFGYSTETALRRFQRDYGLKSDGVAGAQTWSTLLSLHTGAD